MNDDTIKLVTDEEAGLDPLIVERLEDDPRFYPGEDITAADC